MVRVLGGEDQHRITYVAEGWEASFVPQKGAEIGKVVEIKARVDVDCRAEDVIIYIAA